MDEKMDRLYFIGPFRLGSIIKNQTSIEAL